MHGCSPCRRRGSRLTPPPQRHTAKGTAMGDVALAVLTLGAWVFAVSAGSKLRGHRAYRGFVAGLRETGLIPARALRATAPLLAGGGAAIGGLLPGPGA